MGNVLKYLCSALLVLVFASLVAGWTMSLPIENVPAQKVHNTPSDGHTLYSIDDIHGWMFLRQSQSSHTIFDSRTITLKHLNQFSPFKPSNKLMQTSREGTLAQTHDTVIAHSSREHNYYYIFHLRRIIV